MEPAYRADLTCQRFSETELVKLLELPPGLGFYLAYTPDHPGKPSWTRLRRGSGLLADLLNCVS